MKGHRLPGWARGLLDLAPLGERRAEVTADLAELFEDRTGRYGRSYAYRRLAGDILSLWRAMLGGGTVLQDLRYALRLLRKHPVPACITIGGLALAIGVVTAVFSIVNATLLRPYAMDDPASVVSVTRPSHGGWSTWPYAWFLKMQDEATLARVEASLSDTARFSTVRAASDDSSQRVLFVSGGYLRMLGGRPSLGRTLEPADDVAGAPAVLVVSHHFWASRLNRDPSIVGKVVWLNGAPVTLVGVLRADFTGPVEFDLRPALWAPLAAMDDVLTGPPLTAAATTPVEVVARLAAGVGLPAAQDNLAAIVTRGSAAKSVPSAGEPSPVRLYSAASAIDGPAEADTLTALASIFSVAGLVLALACANTANLLMAAAVTRRREMGVRLALGASTRRLVRQMVNESLLLGLMAGGFGFILAIWIVPVFGAIVAMPPDVDLAPDARVLIFTIAVALVCGAGAGLSPARYGARGNVLVALQSQSGSRGSVAVPSRLRTSFVGFQAGVSMLLLVFAALLARTAMLMTRADIGFDADRLLVVALEPLQPGLDQSAYLQRAVAAVRHLPAVERVSVAENEPFGYFGARDRFAQDGRSFELRTTRSDGNYLATLGVPIRRGRTFTAEDVAGHAPVAIISESVARAFFPGGDPIGQSLANVPAAGGRRQEPATIVGVVADALLDRPESQGYGAIYRPLGRPSDRPIFTSQGLPIPPSLIVRTANPGLTARAVEDALRRMDATVRPATTMVRDRLDDYLSGKRMLAWMSGPIALLALLLAALGVYGVTAFVVNQRTEEVGVRMAIGASSADVLRMLVRDSVRPVAVGLAAGLAVALGLSRISASTLMLSGISPHDPLSIGVALATLLTVALAAVIMPARRAARTDPAIVLRQV
jgi:predicted permease